MTEQEFVKDLLPKLNTSIKGKNNKISAIASYKLPYTNEIISYPSLNAENKIPPRTNQTGYETDMMIYEEIEQNYWKPRIVIETKINRISTHDAITYSQKAQTHKNVHPYLRYGILIGNRKHYPLSGRLFRHGQYFDFMQSWKGYDADKNEWDEFISILNYEIDASHALDEVIFNSKSNSRKKFTSLHRQLILKK